MLATAGAVVGLLWGRACTPARWRAGTAGWPGAAAFWFAGLIVSQVLTGPLSSRPPRSRSPTWRRCSAWRPRRPAIMVLAEEKKRNDTGSVLPGLADGYVMAVALLVIAWVVAFGAEFHHSNERPATFLLDLLHPLADLAVLGALLPVLTVAWRRVVVPYIGLMALTFADSLGVGARFSSGHQGILEQLAVIAAACLFGVAPWVETIAARLDLAPWRSVPGQSRSADGGLASLLGGRRSPVTSAGAATIIAAVSVVIAAFVVIINGLASAPASGLALVIAGGAAVLVVAVRILMLVRENGVAMRMWREASNSLRDLADRTGDMVLICDLDGTISYASPLVSGFSYPAEALIGKPLSDFVHPEDIGAARAAIAHGDRPARGRGRRRSRDARWTSAGGRGQPADGGRFSCRVRAADGTWRHVECAVLLYRLPGEPARHAAERQGRIRPGGAPAAGDAPHLPRRAYRPAEPRLRRGARAGGARAVGRAASRASSSSTSTASPRSTT